MLSATQFLVLEKALSKERLSTYKNYVKIKLHNKEVSISCLVYECQTQSKQEMLMYSTLTTG